MSGSVTRHSEIPTILAALKKALRAQGLTYRDLADALGLSLTSIKRYMAGSAVSAQDLERLCQVAGLRLSELVELARREDERQGGFLGEEQEQALIDDQALALVLFLLQRGWAAPELKIQLGLGEARLVGLLSQLDRLRLIDLLPGNRVRLLAPATIRWRNQQQMRRSTYEYLKGEFVKARFDEPGFTWRHELLQLSSDQVEQVVTLCEALTKAARELAGVGPARARPQSGWYGIWTAVQPIRLALQAEASPGTPPAGDATDQLNALSR